MFGVGEDGNVGFGYVERTLVWDITEREKTQPILIW